MLMIHKIQERFMTFRFSLAIALLGAATSAHASECEGSFVKQGNPVTGLRYIATTTVNDMAAPTAVGQLRGIVLGKGYDILAAEPDSGTMLIEQPATGKARSFPLNVTVTNSGTAGRVQIEARLRPTMNVPEAAAKSEMCGILNQLRGGKEGIALARQGNAASASRTAPPLRMSVLAFSSQMAGEARLNSEAMVARHTGKAFTLFGTVATVGRAGTSYRVDFQLLENALSSIVPGSGYRLEISCIMAAGQSTYALGLKPGKRVELTGIFDEYALGRSTIYLRDCRPSA
jgi:hypothetical protein